MDVATGDGVEGGCALLDAGVPEGCGGYVLWGEWSYQAYERGVIIDRLRAVLVDHTTSKPSIAERIWE